MAHIFSVLLCVYIIYLVQPGTSLFSFHPFFMTLGFGLFMFEAILIFSPHSSLVKSLDRKTKSWYHFYLQIAAVVCIELGFAAIYFNKNINNKPHFVSWHGIAGLTATIMATFQIFAGLSLLYNKVYILNPAGTSLATRKKMHAMFGCFVFLSGFLAMFLSLYSTFVLKNTGELTWYLLLALVTVLSSVVVNQVADVYIYKKTDQ